MNHRVRPVTTVLGKRALSLPDCRALALRDNLEFQAARLDELSKRAVEFSNRTKLLPHFIFSGDLAERDNQSFSYSDPMGSEGNAPGPSVGAVAGVNSWSMSNERGSWRYVLEGRWSPTDAALAHYLTCSAVNDTLKSHHKRVRVAQKLLGVVDAAFFRLLGLQQCLPMAKRLLAVRSAIADRREKLLKKGLKTMEDYHKARKQLVVARRLVASLRNEMERQRNVLASAMAVSPEYCVDGGFYVEGVLQEPCYNAGMCDMEMEAVRNRPEAYQAGLNHLNSINDFKRTIVKYFPSITGYWRSTRENDKYILNKDWNDVGLMVYFDVVDWLSNMGDSKAVKRIVAKTQKEIGSVALGISSQVRLAALKYFDSRDELSSTKTSLSSTRRLLQVAEERYSLHALDEIALDSAKADVLQERIKRIRAVGQAQATLAELFSTMGTNYGEPTPRN